MHVVKIQINVCAVCFRTSSRDLLRDETANSSFQQTRIHMRSDGEWSPSQRWFVDSYDGNLRVLLQKKLWFLICSVFLASPGNSRPTSPKSDSELMSKSSDADSQNPTMHWAWGELPQAATVSMLYTVCPENNTVKTALCFVVVFDCFFVFIYFPFLAILPPGEVQPSPSLPSVHPRVWKHALPCDKSGDDSGRVHKLGTGTDYGRRGSASGSRRSWDGVRNRRDAESCRCGNSYDVRCGGDYGPSTKQDRFSLQKKRSHKL